MIHAIMGEQRRTCPSCGRSKCLFCEDCLVILEEPPPAQIRLPVKVDILQHGETNARSTALHAALLAAADVRVLRHPGSRTSRRRSPADLPLPRYDPASTVVLFPEGPQTPVVGQCPPFDLVIVLESSWKKARGLLQHAGLAGLRRVRLPPGAGTLASWRRGDGSFRGAVGEGLSSIEAIAECCRCLAPEHSYDGLLRYFQRTKQLAEGHGPLPTSRQEARAREQQERQARQAQHRQHANALERACPAAAYARPA